MEEKSQNILLSSGFLLGLSFLLVNDFILKQTFHNGLTGKLSDFAGLFIFPIFWAAFFPKWKKYIYLATGLAFAFWKSTYSQPLISWWNMLPFFKVSRTIDYSDLIAIMILPLSSHYISHYRADRLVVRRVATSCVVIISVFAFTATQMADEQRTSTHYGREYHFNISRENLVERLRNTETLYLDRAEYLDRGLGEHYTIAVRHRFCKRNPVAFVEILEFLNQSRIKLLWIEYWCDNVEPQHEQELLSIFENEAIRRLPLSSIHERRPDK